MFEAILAGALIGTEADEHGTKYRVHGTTFLMKRIVELLCAVEVEEEEGQARVVIVTVYERRRKRGRAKRR